MFYMNMRAFNEGEQAEAYKKRKEDEKLDKQIETEERAARRADCGIYRPNKNCKTGDKMTPQNPNYGIKHPIKTIKGKKADKKLEEDILNKTNNNPEYNCYRSAGGNRSGRSVMIDYMNGNDAIKRHFRRHPEKLKEDCGIFESVEFI